MFPEKTGIRTSKLSDENPPWKRVAASDRWRAAVEQKVGDRKSLCCWTKSFFCFRHLWRSDSRSFFWMPSCNKSTTTSNPRPPWNFLASGKLITAEPAVSHWRISLPRQAGVGLSHPLSQLYTLCLFCFSREPKLVESICTIRRKQIRTTCKAREARIPRKLQFHMQHQSHKQI